MTRFLIAVWCTLWLTEPAFATCTQSTVMLPDGRMMFCMTCCSGPGQCHTTCH